MTARWWRLQAAIISLLLLSTMAVALANILNFPLCINDMRNFVLFSHKMWNIISVSHMLWRARALAHSLSKLNCFHAINFRIIWNSSHMRNTYLGKQRLQIQSIVSHTREIMHFHAIVSFHYRSCVISNENRGEEHEPGQIVPRVGVKSPIVWFTMCIEKCHQQRKRRKIQMIVAI